MLRSISWSTFRELFWCVQKKNKCFWSKNTFAHVQGRGGWPHLRSGFWWLTTIGQAMQWSHTIASVYVYKKLLWHEGPCLVPPAFILRQCCQDRRFTQGRQSATGVKCFKREIHLRHFLLFRHDQDSLAFHYTYLFATVWYLAGKKGGPPPTTEAHYFVT